MLAGDHLILLHVLALARRSDAALAANSGGTHVR